MFASNSQMSPANNPGGKHYQAMQSPVVGAQREAYRAAKAAHPLMREEQAATTSEGQGEEEKKLKKKKKECIFTIDPSTARDLDDAVSVKKLGDDLYEVGVHISDVSYFLPLDTPLDQFVAKRATTIYMVDKAIHMLPLELCLQCSLLPGQDKYALSIIWQMDAEGDDD
ncbi:unnamed protein product [Nesidiocoris tenuis]|uniref:RNB domain-containing protein n=1 Tax=Nesidiocoris tenuis TaxID=355587 RepID=A0A6H5G100_9HEMI|nr:unnamed protein product [Nesidiocoris tenuis]